MKHMVSLSDSAVFSFLSAGFEAYFVRHAGRTHRQLEMNAQLFGRKVMLKTQTKHLVEVVSVDTSAHMKKRAVVTNSESTKIKKALSEMIGYEHLGSAHSHPFGLKEERLSYVREHGANFSESDLDAIQHLLLNFGHDTHVELLLTLLPQKNVSTQNGLQLVDNFIEFNIGNCKCFLRAQVFTLVDEKLIQEPTLLKCSVQNQLDFAFDTMPKFRLVKGRKTIFELMQE